MENSTKMLCVAALLLGAMGVLHITTSKPIPKTPFENVPQPMRTVYQTVEREGAQPTLNRIDAKLVNIDRRVEECSDVLQPCELTEGEVFALVRAPAQRKALSGERARYEYAARKLANAPMQVWARRLGVLTYLLALVGVGGRLLEISRTHRVSRKAPGGEPSIART